MRQALSATVRVLFAGEAPAINEAYQAMLGSIEAHRARSDEDVLQRLSAGPYDAVVGDDGALALCLDARPEWPRVLVVSSSWEPLFHVVNRVAPFALLAEPLFFDSLSNAIWRAARHGRTVSAQPSPVREESMVAVQRQAQRTALATLAREVAHDLRNALQNLNLADEMITLANPTMVRECVREERARLQRLDEMLSMCQSVAEPAQPTTSFPLGTGLREVIRVAGPMLAQVGVRVVVEGDPSGWMVSGAKGPWVSAVVALLRQEAAMAGMSTAVTIRIEAEEQDVMLVIESAAPYAPESTGQRLPRGRALAFELLRWVVESVEGTATLSPASDWGGTRVTLTLPVRPPSTSGQWAEASAGAGALSPVVAIGAGRRR